MKKYKIGILGYFANGKSKSGGQEAKTCSMDRLLKNKFGIKNILNIDTTDWKQHKIKLFFKLLILPIVCKNIVVLPAQNSIKYIIPILSIVNIFFKRKIFYSVVGGWLPEYLNSHKYLIFFLKKINKIWVETVTMRDDLRNVQIYNVDIIPNFKYLNEITLQEISHFKYDVPFKLCIFSRIVQEKGIEDAIEAVRYINKSHGKIIFTLDIYGKIEEIYLLEFKKLLKELPSYIIYKGVIEPEKSVQILKNYYALLFPTRYYTEGLPGTIIDAYTAGVPVISSLWKNHKDIFKDGITGRGYEFKNVESLKFILNEIALHPQSMILMKKNCLLEAQKYKPCVIMKKLEKYFID